MRVRKAAANYRKHKVTFEEAATVFLDSLAVTFDDPDHSFDEIREITSGCTLKGRVVFVSHRQVFGGLRIISARRATRKERTDYEESA